MNLKELEKCFTRAFWLSFSKKKGLLVFPILVLCGTLCVFFKALALDAKGWISMSLIFLPILFTSGILLGLGVLLIRMYYHEVKDIPFSFRKIIKSSWQVVSGTVYLSVPSLILYFVLWIMLGIFVLLKEIPGIGSFIGIILAFGPYILILSSLLLCLFNVGLLFFVTPWVGLNAFNKLREWDGILVKVKKQLFAHFFFFLVAIFPMGLMAALLYGAAVLTDIGYLVGQHTFSIAMKWFFMMVPFALFLTPAVIFFFNLAAEAYNLFYKKTEHA